jgi:nucleoside 2-deoxyribosyltransferase
MTLIYNGGDMLSTANQAAHAEENWQLKKLGFQVYSPQDDKMINDKSNQTVESNNSLAEKIFDRDTKGMEQADIIIFEVSNNNVGTTCEVGQWAMQERIKPTGKRYYFHSYDIRRTNIPEVGDRRSWSINQYLYGAILSLNSSGIMSWEDIIKELRGEV